VVTAKDFMLAVLYADYTGDRNHRWKSYISDQRVLSGMSATLAAPDVSTESFTGTIRITHMSAVPGTFGKSTISVSFCEDASAARNTSLSTGKVLPASKQNSKDENYTMNTYVLRHSTAGRWGVIGIQPTVDYPRAFICKP
jgi:hypothetical protein